MVYKQALLFIFAFLSGVSLLSPTPAEADWIDALLGTNHHNDKRVREKQKEVWKAQQDLQKKQRELRKEVRKSYDRRDSDRRRYVGGSTYGYRHPRSYHADKHRRYGSRRHPHRPQRGHPYFVRR